MLLGIHMKKINELIEKFKSIDSFELIFASCLSVFLFFIFVICPFVLFGEMQIKIFF